MKRRFSLKLPATLHNKRSLIYVGGFAVVGLLLLYFVAAASNTAYFEAENASISGSARTVSDASASGGSALQFRQGSGEESQLPTNGTWSDVTGSLPVSDAGVLLAAKPNSNEVYAGIGRQFEGRGIWVHTGSGGWTKLGSGSGSANVNGIPTMILVDPAHTSTFWVSNMYGGGSNAFYKTTNAGQTFQTIGTPPSGGTLSHNDYVSVDFSDPNRQTVLVSGHEAKKTVYRSTDGGQSFTNVGINIPGGDVSFSSHPIAVNSQTYIVEAAASWTSGELGIFRTTNAGNSWTKVSSEEVNGRPLYSSKGYIFFRGGRDYSQTSHLLRSTDGGATWTRISTNNFSLAPLELPDGRLLSATNNRLVVSSDGNGTSWSEFGPTLPCIPSSITYSPGQGAVYLRPWDVFCSQNRNVYRLK